MSDPYERGFADAKAHAIKIMTEWSRVCHPRHPKSSSLKDRCWQHHGLMAAIRSVKSDVTIKEDALARRGIRVVSMCWCRKEHKDGHHERRCAAEQKRRGLL